MAVAHAAVQGWVLKALSMQELCSAPEENSSLNLGAATNLCPGQYSHMCSQGVGIVVLKLRRLRDNQPYFLAPDDSYHVPDSQDTG